MEERAVLAVDAELLALARSILRDEEFVTEESSTESVSILFAENRYFVLALAAAATIDHLLSMEPLLEGALATRLAESESGPKIWDAYLILLTQERLPERGETTSSLFAINYDTKGFRRIAYPNVEPTVAGVRLALTPFVAPVELESTPAQDDPMDAMLETLVVEGIDRSVAARAISVFRQGGGIDDAF